MSINFIKIPLSPADCNPDLISNLQNYGLVSNSVVVWPDANKWFNAHYWGPLLDVPSDSTKTTKVWGVREPDSIVSFYRFAKGKDGNWLKWNVVQNAQPIPGQNPVETIVFPDGLNPGAPVNMIDLLGPDAQNLFAEYGTKINAIPQLELITATDKATKSQNYGGVGFCQLPLNLSWPRSFIPMFGPDGNPALVKIADFIANTPKPSTGSSGKYTEIEIGAAIRKNVGFLDDSSLGKYCKSLVLS